MNVLVTVLLTVIAIVNAFVILTIAMNLKRFKNKSARLGGLIMLSCLIVDLLAIVGGIAVW